ncbi:P2Y purinoceptor 14-like [Dicentrarchus labrax]|uniref:P2Y purinoceptor 14-like n=1 Tax=Dicentrarchus labrax TaxID=13489 RepID=UPI0021F554C8|nr:P2Y purinoceptor 14-like [Dicentrarchus labrax]
MSTLRGVTPSFNQSSVSNQINSNDSTHCNQFDTSAYISFMVVYSLVFLVGLFLNGFTLKVYFCRVQQQASSNKKLAKSHRNMLVLVSVFCVCFVPYHLF